ncbi:MAG: hypothetical protein IJU26_02795 [Synergistaceae bacterium]|nr:hypothetical protein [Synergistaceae bacterium]
MVVNGSVVLLSCIVVSGYANLILSDGATLTAEAGITTTGATLNIYAQSCGTGKLEAGSNGGAVGIGGGSGGAGGTVTISGGTHNSSNHTSYTIETDTITLKDAT